MDQQTHPFIVLRRTIRQSGRQFRRTNDNSKSIFHPNGGFVYAYDMNEVETALDDYEQSLPTEYREEFSQVTIEDKLLREAHTIAATHPTMEIRDFARTVAAYLVMNTDPEKRRNPLKLIRSDFLDPVSDEL